MKKTLITIITMLFASIGIAQPKITTGYASVNGLKMYYEIHELEKTGKSPVPLVLLHGGGSTIHTTFGKILPQLSENQQVIGVELQAHGHTEDVDRPLTFDQDADDVAALLRTLKIANADFFGFSNGGSTALQIAIRHPELVRKMIVASAMYKRDGLYPEFWNFMSQAKLENMPQGLKDAYLKVAPQPEDLIKMHDKCVKRMMEFKDFPEKDVKSIQAPVLVMTGDKDVVRPEHAVEMFRLLPHGQLAILPGDHGAFLGEVTVAKDGSRLPASVAAMVGEFLLEPMPENSSSGKVVK